MGTSLTFTAGSTVVRATLDEDSPATRSLLAMLPMTLRFSDFGGQEKVASPPHRFDYGGSEGMTPEPGVLFSYRPWGNLGFFYRVENPGYSRDLARLGHTDDVEKIRLLEGRDVTIAVGG
ncbi:cyclophilin-like fold protein [Arthrobacter sp. RAF14]|uniref:cyclophilin-like fold protein n=1 Tax=Arthrobacter sp. RAF14 TaxID=3233051 RepID=UPI003F8E40BA